jgi:hopanoid biosynthesis associated RND transporter like protein HpnN
LFTPLLIRLVDFSRQFAWVIVLVAIAVSAALGWFDATHFRINTDVNQLLAANLPWRQQEAAMEKAFPQKVDVLLVVVDGDTPDAAEDGAAALAAKLKAMPNMFTYVERPDAIPFFRKNGLLFLPQDKLADILNELVEAQPLLGMLAADPSLRGLFTTLSLVLLGLEHGEIDYSHLDQPFTQLAATLESALAGQDRPLAWQSMMSDTPPEPRDLRKLIITKPVLDYGDLEPGKKASNAVRALAKKLDITPDRGVRVRLTGSVALNDEEFASVANGAGFATILSAVLVILILWLALHSARLILPILLTLTAGLIATTAVALAAIGSLNLISIAFAVMFIGIAVDFGIQFGVRYRAQRFEEPNHAKALRRTAKIIAAPLAMAAASTSLGFLAFIPTEYRGVSELGFIAGIGMLIAFALSITLFPALLSLFRPPAEREPVGFRGLAPADHFIKTYRRTIRLTALVVAVGGTLVATHVHFDFDPLDLKNPHTESVSTLFDLMKDPDFNPYTIDSLRPSLKEAQTLGDQIGKLPEVDHTMTLASFVPDDQTTKLALIGDTRMLMEPTLDPSSVQPPPTEEQILDILNQTAGKLHAIGKQHASAERLAAALDEVVKTNDPGLLRRLHADLIDGMLERLETVRESLKAARVTVDNITPDLRRDWITSDGRALVEAYPKGDARKESTLIAFTDAVRKIAPDATGSPISIRESGRTVTRAFMHAGCYAFATIFLLSLLILRRLRDVLMLMAPIILAGILTLATIVAIGLELNFANIIALPLLLSLGVSYAIYFVSYWRAGMKDPLQSSMARAVLFSAGTALAAFGTLGLSSHPGTAGMGKLLTVALLYSLTCTFFILPALLGRPKGDRQ